MEIASIWQGATQTFGVGFPQPIQGLLYWGFASLVVHVCQRMVEHAAFSIDLSSRHISASQAALCIGCIVWALDVVGLFMYSEPSHHVLELGSALGCLLVMVFSARLTIPTLSTSTSTRSLITAGLLLALGMLAGHFWLACSHVTHFSEVNALAIALAIASAMGVACYTAMRHHAAKMSALTPRYAPQNWRDKLISGAAILVLHWLLVNCIPLRKPASDEPANGLALLAVLLVFTLALAVEQLRNIRSDQVRQHLQRLGLSLMRVTPAHPKPPEHDIQLSLIADHLPRLLNRNSLTLHFQPIVNVHETQVHYEALLRLNDPLLGPLSPDAFFLVCELQGKTSQVDRLILANALADGRQCRLCKRVARTSSGPAQSADHHQHGRVARPNAAMNDKQPWVHLLAHAVIRILMAQATCYPRSVDLPNASLMRRDQSTRHSPCATAQVLTTSNVLPWWLFAGSKRTSTPRNKP